MKKEKFDISKQVMETIRKENISIRSKYLIVAEKVGLGGVFGFTLLLSIFFLNLLLYSFKVTDRLEYLAFGQPGLEVLLQTFPYHWLLLAILFLALAGWLLKRYDISYRKPLSLLIAGLLALTTLGGIAFAYSSLNERLENTHQLRPLYGTRQGMGRKGILGTVIEARQGIIQIETSSNQRLDIYYDNSTHFPTGKDFNPGERIKVMGEEINGRFEAWGIRHTTSAGLPGMRSNSSPHEGGRGHFSR